MQESFDLVRIYTRLLARHDPFPLLNTVRPALLTVGEIHWRTHTSTTLNQDRGDIMPLGCHLAGRYFAVDPR